MVRSETAVADNTDMDRRWKADTRCVSDFFSSFDFRRSGAAAELRPTPPVKLSVRTLGHAIEEGDCPQFS